MQPVDSSEAGHDTKAVDNTQAVNNAATEEALAGLGTQGAASAGRSACTVLAAG